MTSTQIPQEWRVESPGSARRGHLTSQIRSVRARLEARQADSDECSRLRIEESKRRAAVSQFHSERNLVASLLAAQEIELRIAALEKTLSSQLIAALSSETTEIESADIDARLKTHLVSARRKNVARRAFLEVHRHRVDVWPVDSVAKEEAILALAKRILSSGIDREMMVDLPSGSAQVRFPRSLWTKGVIEEPSAPVLITPRARKMKEFKRAVPVPAHIHAVEVIDREKEECWRDFVRSVTPSNKNFPFDMAISPGLACEADVERQDVFAVSDGLGLLISVVDDDD